MFFLGIMTYWPLLTAFQQYYFPQGCIDVSYLTYNLYSLLCFFLSFILDIMDYYYHEPCPPHYTSVIQVLMICTTALETKFCVLVIMDLFYLPSKLYLPFFKYYTGWSTDSGSCSPNIWAIILKCTSKDDLNSKILMH